MKNCINNTLKYLINIIKIANKDKKVLEDLAIEKYDECLANENQNFNFEIYEYLCCRVINCIDGHFVFENMDKNEYKQYEKDMQKRLKNNKYYNELLKLIK